MHAREDVDYTDDKQINTCGELYKWTNYIYGWQKRYFELENGVLIYYKSKGDKRYGSRGSISLQNARVVESEVDRYRFDVMTGCTAWYLRAETRKGKKHWLQAVKAYVDVCDEGELSAYASDAADGSTSSSLHKADQISENPKLTSKTQQIADAQIHFALLPPLTIEKLLIKMDELERYSNAVDRQAVRLEKLIMNMEGCADRVYARTLTDEGVALNAVAIAVLQNVRSCLDILIAQAKPSMERSIVSSNPVLPANFNAMLRQSPVPESLLSDEEQDWHDAIETLSNTSDNQAVMKKLKETIKTSRAEREADIDVPNTVLTNRSERDYDITQSPSNLVTLPLTCCYTREIEAVMADQLEYAKAPVSDNIWKLFWESGDMKMYKRHLEVNGIVHDPVKATHTVQGVSAREYIHYFFEPCYKHEWDDTLVSTRLVENISSDTVVIHQIHKKIWPAAQRESLFWSHVRRLDSHKGADALDLYMVTNHNCTRDDTPLRDRSNVRVGITVVMLCETISKKIVKETKDLTRDDVECRICYCAQIDPGGWLPTAAVRLLADKEYPKFLSGFSDYVLKNLSSSALVI